MTVKRSTLASMISSINESHVLPARYSTAKYDDVPEDVRKLVTAMVKTRKGLYIHGGCGTGKTHMAYSIWSRFKEKQVKARFYKSTEMLDVIRDFYGKRNVDYGDNELKKLLNYDGLLIIDDLGAEKPTEWVAETFYKIIDKRYETMLPTIFTSNLSLGELSKQISDRIASRIAEMCEVVKVDGVDKRL